MYEDSAIELGTFPRGGRIFCIASAGCTAMALAPHHEVVAVDVNAVQLAYAERRFAGDPGEAGAAERFMGVGRTLGPLVGWWPSRVQYFLALTHPEQQILYWQKHLDTQRFRTAVDALLSIPALRRVYAAAFLDFLPSHLGAVMRTRLERCFSRHANASNPYARGLLVGELSAVTAPPEAKDIRLAHADAADFLERQTAGSFDGFTLSNILDGADTAYKRRLSAAVKHAASREALVVLRSFREPSCEGGAALPDSNRAADDRAALWGMVDVRPTRSLSEFVPATRV